MSFGGGDGVRYPLLLPVVSKHPWALGHVANVFGEAGENESYTYIRTEELASKQIDTWMMDGGCMW